MKKLFTLSLLFLALLNFKVSAQNSLIGDINYALLDKYIAAAKENYPRRKILAARAESVKSAIPMSKLSYLDLFSASYFYRPDQNTVITTPGSTTANPYSVNGFQFGVNLNLGSFLQKPYMVKRAKAEYKVAKLEAQEYEATLENDVKRRYYTYIREITQLKINTQSVQDNQNVADNLKNKFTKGEITLDTYNQSRINLANANTSKIDSEVNLLLAKDQLEEIIGQKLSEIK